MKAVLLSFIFLFSGCAKPNYQEGEISQKKTSSTLKASGYQISFSWEKMPTEETYGSFVLKFSKPGQSSIKISETLNVFLWMPSMGHGSAEVSIKPLSNGLYQINDVFFTMPGEWEIHVELKKGEKTVDKTVFTLTI